MPYLSVKARRQVNVNLKLQKLTKSLPISLQTYPDLATLDRA
jgi:hypothetical protein